jgi:hypothetical protein
LESDAQLGANEVKSCCLSNDAEFPLASIDIEFRIARGRTADNSKVYRDRVQDLAIDSGGNSPRHRKL